MERAGGCLALEEADSFILPFVMTARRYLLRSINFGLTGVFSLKGFVVVLPWFLSWSRFWVHRYFFKIRVNVRYKMHVKKWYIHLGLVSISECLDQRRTKVEATLTMAKRLSIGG